VGDDPRVDAFGGDRTGAVDERAGQEGRHWAHLPWRAIWVRST
jgi:hypothetical protein